MNIFLKYHSLFNHKCLFDTTSITTVLTTLDIILLNYRKLLMGGAFCQPNRLNNVRFSGVQICNKPRNILICLLLSAEGTNKNGLKLKIIIYNHCIDL